MDSPPNHEWEQALDIDDSNLRLTLVVRRHILPERTTTTQTMFLSQNHQVDNCVMKPIRIITCHAGIVQMAKLRKITDTREGEDESLMSINVSLSGTVGSVDTVAYPKYGIPVGGERMRFLGVGTTFDIFQNIHLLYLQYGVLVFSRYGVFSLLDTAYWLSEQ
ncbi:hypothetical protein Tco_0844643 [Tanacetum coccineum]